jgi:hypothetical protein
MLPASGIVIESTPSLGVKGNRVGGGITPAVLPHHADVPFGIRRFMKPTGSVVVYPATKPAPCGRTSS